jgi:hypothetical protein
MYRRICLISDFSVAGTVHSLFESYGLHPLPLNTSAHVSVAGADQCYYIELPEEEIKKGQEILIGCGREKDII